MNRKENDFFCILLAFCLFVPLIIFNVMVDNAQKRRLIAMNVAYYDSVTGNFTIRDMREDKTPHCDGGDF